MAAKNFWLSNYEVHANFKPRSHTARSHTVASSYVEATDDFQVTDDTETTTEQFQEQYANLYAMGFRLGIG